MVVPKSTSIVMSACETRTAFGADWVDRSISSARSSTFIFFALMMYTNLILIKYVLWCDVCVRVMN